MKLRNLLQTVLSTTATKREARQYIQKYGKHAISKPLSIIRISGRDNHSALNSHFGPALGRTLSHMKDLGAFPVIMIDGTPQITEFLANKTGKRLRDYESQLVELSEKLGGYLAPHGKQAMVLTQPFEFSVVSGMEVKSDWLDQALANHQIPIMLPLMYDRDTNEAKLVDSFQCCQALAQSISEPFVMDKIVFIDPLGGLPSQRRRHAAHVLVNLLQEYGEIHAELRGPSGETLGSDVQNAHLANLNAMRDILDVSGPRSTGLITDPHAAGTMLGRNPIIYNILTDRPLISPSLPSELKRTQLRTSLIRTGFPVYVQHSADPTSGLDLYREDKVGNINLTKLRRLIESSFGKKIDMNHYLDRLKSAVAAIIVVGDYDGAAIITWEQQGGRKIAYLDKFAVDPSSQGAQGVADIMLIQMIRRLFPRELLWRSRSTNPVNKWYFERSRGHMRLSGSEWTMFWITDAEIPPVEEYEEVCRNIEPSLVAAK